MLALAAVSLERVSWYKLLQQQHVEGCTGWGGGRKLLSCRSTATLAQGHSLQNQLASHNLVSEHTSCMAGVCCLEFNSTSWADSCKPSQSLASQ